MTVTFTLRQFVEHVASNASRIFKQRGELLPMYHAVDAGGSEAVFPSPHPNKDVAVAIVRNLLKQFGATRVAYIDEAWMVDASRGEIDVEKADREGISDHPNKIEVIIISVEDHQEGLMMATCEIIRHGNKAVLGKLKIMGEDNKDGTESFQGRMVGLLPNRTTKH